MANLKAVEKFLQDKGIEYFLCSFVEMGGMPKAKLIPAKYLEDMASGSAGFAGFAVGNIGQGPHDPDMVALPDFESIMQVPWRKNVAWVASDIHVEGKPWQYCPRTIFRGQLRKALKKGFAFKTGTECEFFLLKKNADGHYEPYDALDIHEKPCYDLGALNRSLDFMTTLIHHMEELGWGPYASDHEDANCQFEINWTYSDALRTADRQTFFRWMVKALAEERGLLATFMPKPFAHLTGNGAHLHMSLWDPKTDVNLFLDEKDENGLSQMAYHFIGGLKKHAKALAAVTSPTVNSYKRLKRGSTRSGATWAPVFITYGGSNRTQMIRIPAPGRIEMRTMDGASNSYLAGAAILAAGLDGIETKAPAGKRNDRNLYETSPAELKAEGLETLPATLHEALDALEKDKVILDVLGSSYAEYYLRVKRDEWREYHESVSEWELQRYLHQY
jgi:glutamine synthetase